MPRDLFLQSITATMGLFSAVRPSPNAGRWLVPFVLENIFHADAEEIVPGRFFELIK